MNVAEQIKSDLLNMVQRHDYSYMMSDSHDVWEAGMKYEKEIEAKIHSLFIYHREDMEGLYNEIITLVPEQFVSGLAHKVIKSWFKTYIGK